MGTVKLETFTHCDRAYKACRKLVHAQQRLYKLAEDELATMIYLNTRGDARDALDQLEVDEMTVPGGLATKMVFARRNIWRAGTQQVRGRRKEIPFLLQRLKKEYPKEDPDTKNSDKSFAQRMPNRAGLCRRERHDVWFSAGAKYDPREIGKVLRHKCVNAHDDDPRKTPGRRPKRSTTPGRHHRPHSASRNRKAVIPC